MKTTINLDELTTVIANEIREKGLNEIISLENVRKRVVEKIKLLEQPEKLEELENLAVKNANPIVFPDKEDIEGTIGTKLPPEVPEITTVGKENGAEPIGPEYEPKTGYIPELPEIIRNQTPGKIIVYDINELSLGGENLSNKPFPLFDDPDIKKSMHEMWLEDGKQKADVYLANFEKAGELEFDYVNGTAKFVEKRCDTEPEEVDTYQENPYTKKATPQITTDETIKKQIETAVDLEQIVKNAVSDILKDYFSKKSTDAVELETDISVSDDDTIEPVKETSPTLASLTEINSIYEKVDTPTEVKKAIIGKESKAKKLKENKEVKGWEYDGEKYYLPLEPISINKCYTKKD